MAKDIVPGLLEGIRKDFEKSLVENDGIRKAIELLESKKANYKNANDFSIEVGNVLADVLQDRIKVENLPDGRMYYNVAERILNSTMGQAHDIIADYSKDVQTALNHEAKIKVQGIKADLNQDRIDGIINKVSTAETFEEVAWLMDEPIKNFCQSIVDDTIKKNVDHHHKLGLEPVIKRVSTGNCCDWCDEIDGTYRYPDVPQDIYRRHRYCRCRVDYYPGDGRVQNVHTKRWTDPESGDKIETRKEKSQEGKGDNIRLKNIAHAKAKELGYDPLPQDKVVEILREESKGWIKNLSEDEKRAISKYTYNGKDNDGIKLYRKINGYFSGNYDPANEEEKYKILRYYANIKNAILKNKSNYDIIVYRKDDFPNELSGVMDKFLSTSVTQKGTFGGEPNVAIIVPKQADGAYIEHLAQGNFKKQREFLINEGSKLKMIDAIGEIYYYIVEV